MNDRHLILALICIAYTLWAVRILLAQRNPNDDGNL